MKFISTSNQWYKHWSLWGILFLGVLPFLEANAHLVSFIVPPHLQPYANLILAIIVAVLRFVHQGNINDDK